MGVMVSLFVNGSFRSVQCSLNFHSYNCYVIGLSEKVFLSRHLWFVIDGHEWNEGYQSLPFFSPFLYILFTFSLNTFFVFLFYYFGMRIYARFLGFLCFVFFCFVSVFRFVIGFYAVFLGNL